VAIDGQNADQLIDGDTISSKHDIGHLSGSRVDTRHHMDDIRLPSTTRPIVASKQLFPGLNACAMAMPVGLKGLSFLQHGKSE
jgi:hypothetical protein